ncbi:hypothetical protein GYH30_019018 [Glycine max]|nr:hypothetical protein GYH30_019018 [Glycine max]
MYSYASAWALTRVLVPSTGRAKASITMMASASAHDLDGATRARECGDLHALLSSGGCWPRVCRAGTRSCPPRHSRRSSCRRWSWWLWRRWRRRSECPLG